MTRENTITLIVIVFLVVDTLHFADSVHEVVSIIARNAVLVVVVRRALVTCRRGAVVARAEAVNREGEVSSYAVSLDVTEGEVRNRASYGCHGRTCLVCSI